VERFYTPEQDGLQQSWAGETVWLSPPTSRGEVDRWLGKAWWEVRQGATVVALVPHEPAAVWWGMWVRALADGQDPRVTVEVRELPDRVHFLNADGTIPRSGHSQQCAIVIYRPVEVTS
jgi:hypothetical protein